jgi:hypothetical protein
MKYPSPVLTREVIDMEKVVQDIVAFPQLNKPSPYFDTAESHIDKVQLVFL